MNSTRNALYKELLALGLPLETSTGARTKFNRNKLGIPKTHALDAVCVGDVEEVIGWKHPTLQVKAIGRGSYKRTRSNKYGFPVSYCTRQKKHFGFQTGDLIRATISKGRHEGHWTGRIVIRASGYFSIKTEKGKFDVACKYFKIIQQADGYYYGA